MSELGTIKGCIHWQRENRRNTRQANWSVLPFEGVFQVTSSERKTGAGSEAPTRPELELSWTTCPEQKNPPALFIQLVAARVKMLWRVTLAVAVVCIGGICNCVRADVMSRLMVPRDYGVKLCGREFIRAVIFTCGGSRWKRSIEGDLGELSLPHRYWGLGWVHFDFDEWRTPQKMFWCLQP